MIICLETSTNVCSVALCDSKGTVAIKEGSESRSHASQLTVLIEEILTEAGLKAGDLEAVAVSRGPGSYTGLRIGVSVAKGICYAARIPLIGVDTLKSMFYGIDEAARRKYELGSDSLYIPMLDARRMEVYYSIFASDGSSVGEIKAEILDENSFTAIPENIRILIFGEGAEKGRHILRRKNTVFAEEFMISASYMHNPAYKALMEQRFEDVAYFEPFYLKDFITSHPKKNILGR